MVKDERVKKRKAEQVEEEHAEEVVEDEVEDEEDEEDDSGTEESEESEREGIFDGVEVSFADLGVSEEICRGCSLLGWTKPTNIQKDAIPHALQGRDIIGLAETGSGKTGAFTIPLLCGLLKEPTRRLYALILSPTRELAFQIHEVAQALGSVIGAKSCCIVGGVDKVSQAIALAKKPHIVIGTPGRVVDHLENTKGFSLDSTRLLVLDEADRMLSMDFQEEIDTILQVMPPRSKRQTFLFSATMTAKVSKLKRASLNDPIKVEVSKSKYQTVKTLVQQYLFIPAKYKDVYLVYILNELAGQTAIIFTATVSSADRLALTLRNLGIGSIALHGQMAQTKRLGALNNFKTQGNNVLIATDVAARGLDIPSVDLVVNYDVPGNSKDYVHRVGRTARAGKAGRAVTIVTQYELELYQRIEEALQQKVKEEFPAPKELVMVLFDRVTEASRQAVSKLKEREESGKGKKRRISKPGSSGGAAGPKKPAGGAFSSGGKKSGGFGGGGKKRGFGKRN